MRLFNLFKLFIIFVKIGAILLGGGYVIYPIIENEFVKKHVLLTSEELINYFALSQSLPGIIAANMSMFVGYNLHGKLGAIVAMLGVIFVPFFSIVLLAYLLNELVNNKYVQGVLWGIGIAVIALILLTIREMWQKSTKNIFFYSIFVLALILLLLNWLTPVQVILICSVVGCLYKKIFESR